MNEEINNVDIMKESLPEVQADNIVMAEHVNAIVDVLKELIDVIYGTKSGNNPQGTEGLKTLVTKATKLVSGYPGSIIDNNGNIITDSSGQIKVREASSSEDGTIKISNTISETGDDNRNTVLTKSAVKKTVESIEEDIDNVEADIKTAKENIEKNISDIETLNDYLSAFPEKLFDDSGKILSDVLPDNFISSKMFGGIVVASINDGIITFSPPIDDEDKKVKTLWMYQIEVKDGTELTGEFNPNSAKAIVDETCLNERRLTVRDGDWVYSIYTGDDDARKLRFIGTSKDICIKTANNKLLQANDNVIDLRDDLNEARTAYQKNLFNGAVNEQTLSDSAIQKKMPTIGFIRKWLTKLEETVSLNINNTINNKYEEIKKYVNEKCDNTTKFYTTKLSKEYSISWEKTHGGIEKTYSAISLELPGNITDLKKVKKIEWWEHNGGRGTKFIWINDGSHSQKTIKFADDTEEQTIDLYGSYIKFGPSGSSYIELKYSNGWHVLNSSWPAYNGGCVLGNYIYGQQNAILRKNANGVYEIYFEYYNALGPSGKPKYSEVYLQEGTADFYIEVTC